MTGGKKSKYFMTHEITWNSNFSVYKKVPVEHSHTQVLTHYLCLFLHYTGTVVTLETAWFKNPQILTIWLFPEKSLLTPGAAEEA